MNMKKLLILPIVGIVVSMLGVSVLAAGSATVSTAASMTKDIYNSSLNRQTGQSPSYSSSGQ